MKLLKLLNDVLDLISSGCFKTLGNGQRAYFPHGAWSRSGGYLLPDEAAAEGVRRKIRRFWYFTLVLCGLSGPVSNALFDALNPAPAVGILITVLAALGLASYCNMRWAAAGLEKTDAKITVRESFNTQFKTMPLWFAIFQVVFSAAMVLAGVFMIRDGSSTSDLAWGIAATVMFSGLLVVSGIGLWVRGRSA